MIKGAKAIKLFGERFSFRRGNLLQLMSIVLFAIFMVMLYLRSTNPGALDLSSENARGTKHQQPKNLKEHTRKVSVHLQDFHRRAQMERDRAQLENLKVAPAPTNRDLVKEPTLEPGVDLSQENDTLLEDLRGVKGDAHADSPSEFIYEKVAEHADEETEALFQGLKINDDQKQFIRNVIARFRKDGMEPIISRNLIITGYRKIDKFTGEVLPKVYHLDQPTSSDSQKFDK